MIRRLMEMTREDVRDTARSAIAVLPIGSAEQHGPHLPLGTDTFLVEAVLATAAQLPEVSELPLVVTPTVPIGYSAHHLFAAAVSLRPETLLCVLRDIGDSLVASGFRRLFILNGHGGNDECIQLAVKDLVLRHEPVAAAACSYWAIGSLDNQLRHELTPGHAGWFETSLMLASHADLVRGDRLPTDSEIPGPLFARRDISGLRVQLAGEWARVGGVTDPPGDANESDGRVLLQERGAQLAAALSFFAAQTENVANRPQDTRRGGERPDTKK